MYDNTIIGCKKITGSVGASPSITVLGTSNGAHATVANLVSSGHAVTWSSINDYENKNWAYLLKHKKLKWTRGFPETVERGECDLEDVITDDFDAAIRNARVILIVTPANRHETYIRKLAEISLKDKFLIFMPGSYASLRLNKILRDAGKPAACIITEISCLIYSSKVKEPGYVNIKSIKSSLHYGVMPAAKSSQAKQILEKIYPQFKPTKNVIDVNFLDACTIQHPVTTIFNASRIAHHGNEDCGHYNISEEVGRIIDLVDNEKLQVQDKFGCIRGNTSYILDNYYDLGLELSKTGSFKAISSVPWYILHKLPVDLNFRYISEDIPFGIVPLISLSKLVEVDCHYANIVADICGKLNNIDYFENGYTLEKLGIDNLSIDEIDQYLESGVLENMYA